MNWEKFALQVLRIKRYYPTIIDFGEVQNADMIEDEKWQYIKIDDLFRIIWKSIWNTSTSECSKDI